MQPHVLRSGRISWKAALVVAVAAGAVGAGYLVVRQPVTARPVPREGAPSLILISVDSLRPDHLGCYGYHRNTSPTIDRIAREGALFETAMSSTSWTLPAHAALFTSLPDRVHGCVDDLQWLDGSRLTLAEALRAVGYKTAGFFSGPYLHPCFGFSQGFDRYHDCTSYSRKSIELIQEKRFLDPLGPGQRMSFDLMKLSHDDITNPTVLREVTSWLAQRPEGPFFLFIHLWDVHYDYVAPPPYDTLFDPDYRGPVDGRNLLGACRKPPHWTAADVAHLEALYDGEIRSTDDTIARILEALEAEGLEDGILLAITADHGEAFYEHGLHGHRLTLHDEEVRIPLILRYPPAIPAGTRVGGQACIIDIAPTLLELAGAPPLPHALGRSLVPVLEGSAGGAPDEPAVCELTVPASGVHLFALRTPSWKVIYDFSRRDFRVFDLARDPAERTPLDENTSPFNLAELHGLYRGTAVKLQEAARRLPTPGERDTPPISKMTEAQLRTLGYLK
ncbi:MAG: sulfatase [Planctomycetes bacterium]|nr:sulfatase [Planctomycetota bacterium]